MINLFDTLGSLLRSTLALGTAACWGWASMLLSGAHIAGNQLAALSALAQIALVGGAVVLGFVALVWLTRGQNKAAQKPRARSAQPRHERADAPFDPDAIIARHLQRRRERLSCMPAPRFHAAQHRPLGAQAGFGRKHTV